MRELVSYSCSSCGGALTVDKSQEVYECPFCGNAFDFVQMHHDELLKDAATNMRQMEFVSAKEKYNSILVKDPQDFEALRGLALCEGNLMSVDSLRKPDKLIGTDLDPVAASLKTAKEQAKETDKPYFNKFAQVIELAQDYQKEQAKNKNLKNKSNSQFNHIVEVDEKREEERQKNLERAKTVGRGFAYFFSGWNFYDEEQRSQAGIFGLVVIGLLVSAFLIVFFGFFSIPIFLVVIGVFIAVIVVKNKAAEAEKASYRSTMKNSQAAGHIVSLKVAEIEKDYSEAYRALVKMEPKAKVAKAVTYTPRTK